jgi:DNA/RNA non-specific endonuclease
LEFGETPELALGSAGDTYQFTNCTPQHAGFDRGRQTWQGIERLTGLSFVYGKDERSLTECDPLETGRLPRRGWFSPNESVGTDVVPSGYLELMELDDIAI